MAFDLTPRPDSDHLSAKPHYIQALKGITGGFSGLSLFGALTILFFHVCCSRLWPNTVVRHIVVMLSVADLLVAVSHIWGATQDLEKFMEAYHPSGTNFSSSDIQCTAQAVLAVVGTLASFLWTLALVLYVLIVTSMQGKVAVWCQNSAIVALYSVPCWGFPLVITIVLGRLYLLGYAEGVDLGWCYISISHSKTYQRHLQLLFSYELWSWIIIGAIISCVVVYIIVYCCKRYYGICEVKMTSRSTPHDERTPVQVTNDRRLLGGDDDGSNSQNSTSPIGGDSNDGVATVRNPTNRQAGINIRPVLAGVLLLILRSFSTIVDIAVMANHDKYYHANWVAYMVVFAAIGDSLQGFVNMFLFVWCTPQVYTKCSCCKSNQEEQANYMQIQ